MKVNDVESCVAQRMFRFVFSTHECIGGKKNPHNYKLIRIVLACVARKITFGGCNRCVQCVLKLTQIVVYRDSSSKSKILNECPPTAAAEVLEAVEGGGDGRRGGGVRSRSRSITIINIMMCYYFDSSMPLAWWLDGIICLL